MRDPFNWSLSLGSWWGLVVRVHGSFLVFVAATLYLCWPSIGVETTDNLFQVVLIGFAVLFGSVLLHEVSHFAVARWDQSAPREIVLGPLGGLTNWHMVSSPRSIWCLSLAGPVANLGVVVAGLIALGCMGYPLHLSNVLNPFGPSWIEARESQLAAVLYVGVWINGLLFLANLLPAFPFDGGGILYASLLMLRPRMSRRLAAELVFWIAVLTAGGILLMSLILWKHAADSLFPTWFALILLAIVLLVSARRDVLRDVAELSKSSPRRGRMDAEKQIRSLTMTARAFGPTPEWLDEDPSSDADWREHTEEDDEQQLDDVLHRLHVGGMNSLSNQDRRLLQRISARYRARRDRHHE